MSTKFTLNRLANAPQARLRIYSGGHQVHVDLDAYDVEELAREAFKVACEFGHNPFPQAVVTPPKSKRKRAKNSDDWKS